VVTTGLDWAEMASTTYKCCGVLEWSLCLELAGCYAGAVCCGMGSLHAVELQRV
jgi:hypothetical protein